MRSPVRSGTRFAPPCAQPPEERGRRWGSRGQSLVEFALVSPVLFTMVAAIIQFGLIFWTQNTLTQVARDTGRWAATQVSCSDTSAVSSTANAIAADSTLFGYPSSPLNVSTSWSSTSGPCPPETNQHVSFVTVQIDYQIPVFFPFVPGGGNLSTSAEFRMEPEPK